MSTMLSDADKVTVTLTSGVQVRGSLVLHPDGYVTVYERYDDRCHRIVLSSVAMVSYDTDSTATPEPESTDPQLDLGDTWVTATPYVRRPDITGERCGF